MAARDDMIDATGIAPVAKASCCDISAAMRAVSISNI
jgi:hypothetical protein